LLARAAEIDLGFDPRIFAEMLQTLDRYKDADIPMSNSNAPEIRTFFNDWVTELLEKEDPA
jgi:hypothetical protein